jgi:lipopolysaccharide transport system ATP-binding protein
MSNTVIKVENIGKLYRLGEISTGTISHDLNRWFARMRGKEDPFAKLGEVNDRTVKGESDYVWALKNINFEVKQGEVLGIIGRNGAGKSTLLKILSKITTPTTGSIKIKGRIASLLEVGTGFHPELTGRENVFLNGAILGMTKAEIKKKFDEMVDFSGVEKYIDTPVKRYSSGMYVRLAFAVAAFLESEILIVDEVLAVGDSVFQRKCIDKMMDIGKQGRTIFFVSHNLSSIRSLCQRGILMHNGMMVKDDVIDTIIETYTHQAVETKITIDLQSVKRSTPLKSLSFNQISFNSMPFKFGEPIRFSLKVQKNNDSSLRDLDFGIAIKDIYNNQLIHISNRFINKNFDWENEEFGDYYFSIDNNLKAGFYYMELFLRANDIIQDWLSEKVMIEIEDGNPYGFNDTSQIQGIFLPKFTIEDNEEKII